MESFRCYDNSDVIATLVMTNFHLNTTVVAIFPNVCLWRHSLCSDLVLTLKNCTEPHSYATTAYVVRIWPSFSFRLFRKNLGNLRDVFGQTVFRPPPPPGKKFPVRLWKFQTGIFVEWKAPYDFFTQETSTLNPLMFIFIVCKLLLHLKCLKHTET